MTSSWDEFPVEGAVNQYQRQLMPFSLWCCNLNVFAVAEWQKQLLWWGLVERKSNCQWKMTGNPRHRACQNPPQSFSAFASAALIPSWTSVWLLHTWCVSPVYFREQKKRLTVLLSFLGWWFFGFHVHSSLHREWHKRWAHSAAVTGEWCWVSRWVFTVLTSW